MNARGIEICAVSKAFGRRAVLEDINLQVQPGECLALLGTSGSGKSTLLNVVAGLERATSGKIMIGTRDVTREDPRDRDVAMVFQSFGLYPTMSVFGNMSFALRMNGVDRTETAERVARLANMLQISHLLERRPAQLSGGEQQRVAIGRALARRPSVLLLDEPLSNLDGKLRNELRGELKRILAFEGVTAIYVTHDYIEAMTLGQRIAILHEGALLQSDLPEVVYNRPASRTVASLVGSPTIRFVEGYISYIDAVPTLLAGDGGLVPLPGLAFVPDAGRRVVLGVRAEHVTVSKSGPGSGIGRVAMIERTGADCYIGLDVHGATFMARGRPDFSPGANDPVAFWIDGRAVSLFCPLSGRRVEAAD